MSPRVRRERERKKEEEEEEEEKCSGHGAFFERIKKKKRNCRYTNGYKGGRHAELLKLKFLLEPRAKA